MSTRRKPSAAPPPGRELSGRWLVPLPRDAEPPYRVWVNGVRQTEGRDYRVVDRALAFERPLAKERLGFWRWTAMFFALFGSYGKNDSVDVQYRHRGQDRVATGLDIIAPEPGPR